jgi:ArsR family transcriptional regulator, arsenate/arsenite/antimonite-responsive transcriptional repressor
MRNERSRRIYVPLVQRKACMAFCKAKLSSHLENEFNKTKMPKNPSNADLKFRAISDRTRLRILYLLLGGEMCVCDLVDILKVPQPTASRHLAYLRKAGLVAAEKRGLWMYYSMVPARTIFHKSLMACLTSCFGEVPELRQDKARQVKLKRSGRCG